MSELQTKLDNLRENGSPRGLFPGFDCLYEITSFRNNYPLYICGAPHAGKTEFALEIAMVMAEVYDMFIAVKLFETGDTEDIIGELCSKYIGKPYMKMKSGNERNEFAMSDEERYNAEAWVQEHFCIMNQKKTTMKSYLGDLDKVEQAKGKKVDFSLLDPISHLSREDCQTDRDDRYLEYALDLFNDNSMDKKRINAIVTHSTKIPPAIDKQSGNRYTPPALPTEWASGQVWHRFGYTMLYCYRPPKFLRDEHGCYIHQENETIIYNQKAKPKGTGKLGEAKLFWDWKKNRYYEEDAGGVHIYSHSKK